MPERVHSTPEDLVAAIRQAVAKQQRSFYDTLFRDLVGIPVGLSQVRGGFCEPTISKVGRRFGIHPGTHEYYEFRQRCHGALWKRLFKHHPGTSIWERRFRFAFRRLALTEMRGLLRQRERWPVIDEVVHGPFVSYGTRASSLPQFRHLRLRQLQDCIAKLPDRLQLAIRLDLEGVPVESRHQDEETIASRLKVTPRQVRNYFRQAEALLYDCLRDRSDG